MTVLRSVFDPASGDAVANREAMLAALAGL